MAKVTVKAIDTSKLLSAVTSSKSYKSAMKKRLNTVLAPRAQAEATAHYQHIIKTISAQLTTGIAGPTAPPSSISVASRGGGNVRVDLSPAWAPLAARYLARKQHTKRAPGRDKLWLYRGQLRRAFIRVAALEHSARISIAGVRPVGSRIAFDLELTLSKLPRRWLDDAIRSVVIEALDGRESGDWQPLAGAPTGKRSGLMRGFGAETKRPLLRPISRRLGRQMREDVLKSLKSRR